MIKTKEDLRIYLQSDSLNYQKVFRAPLISKIKNWLNCTPISNQWNIWRYIYALRHVEYHINNKGVWHKLLLWYWLWRLRQYSYKTMFQIPPNTVGKGLTIWHWGPIIVNSNSRIGDFCTLYPGVLIGHKSPLTKAPIIGNNVFIGSGAKIIGEITIGNNVIIGQNVVINKDVSSDSTIVVNHGRHIK